MADLIKAPINYAVSAGGQFVKGGSVVFGFINIRPDAANPATLKPIYLDSALTSQAANPQGLSSDAVFNQSLNGVLFGADDDSYSVIIYDANDVELSYIPVYELSDANAAASAQAAEAGAITAQGLAEAAQLAAEEAQSAAEAAALSAGISLAEFVNRYLGSYVSDPALDPAGSPPQEGSLYWNSAGTPRFKVFTSGAWVYPLDLALGSAAYADLGTAADQVPTNADVRNPRNRIVNPSMAISQENGDGPTVVGSVSTYGSDQFASTNRTSTGTLTTTRTTLSGRKANRLTVTTPVTDLSGTKDVLGFAQPIEAQNCFDLNGKEVSLAFLLNCNFTGVVSAAISNSDFTRTYVVEFNVVAGENQLSTVLTLEAGTVLANDNSAGLWVQLANNNEGTRQTSTLDAWQGGFFVSGNNDNQWTKTINNYVEITNVDLYAGNVPREFQPNSYAQDLAECQRYYIDLLGGDTSDLSPIGMITYWTTISARCIVALPTHMRGTPSLLISPVTGFTVLSAGNVRTSSAAVISTATPSAVEFALATSAAVLGESGWVRTNGTSTKLAAVARL